MSTKYITSSNNTYKTYVANLSQVGTSPPSVTVLDNTFVSTMTWTYDSTGEYLLTSTNNDFVSGKTMLFITPIDSAFIKIRRLSDNVINVGTQNISGVKTNGLLDNVSIEIRVYN
jgi:hypothetical protein